MVGSVLVAAAASAVWMGSVGQVESEWINPAGGVWSDPANWSDGVPGSTTIAVFDTDPAMLTPVEVQLTADQGLWALDVRGGWVDIDLGGHTLTMTVDCPGTRDTLTVAASARLGLHDGIVHDDSVRDSCNVACRTEGGSTIELTRLEYALPNNADADMWISGRSILTDVTVSSTSYGDARFEDVELTRCEMVFMDKFIEIARVTDSHLVGFRGLRLLGDGVLQAAPETTDSSGFDIVITDSTLIGSDGLVLADHIALFGEVFFDTRFDYTIEPGVVLQLHDATFSPIGTIDGSEIRGRGDILGDVGFNNCIIDPGIGDELGDLTFGQFARIGASLIRIHVKSVAEGLQHDFIHLLDDSGPCFSQVQVTFNGPDPVPEGTAFDLITTAETTPLFLSGTSEIVINHPPHPGLRFAPSICSTGLRVSVIPESAPTPNCCADISEDNDGVVAFSDITLLLAFWLSDEFPAMDINQNGIVDFGDITQVLAQWLETCP